MSVALRCGCAVTFAGRAGERLRHEHVGPGHVGPGHLGAGHVGPGHVGAGHVGRGRPGTSHHERVGCNERAGRETDDWL